MGNCVIAYENLCLASDAVFTPDSEHASHDADNLSIAHPAKVWRMTSVEDLTPRVLISWDYARTFDLVAPLYVTASSNRSLFKSDISDSTPWPQTGLTGVNALSGAFSETTGIPFYNIASSSGGTNHHILATYDRVIAAGWTVPFTLFWNSNSPFNWRFQLENAAGTGYGRVDVNGTGKSINSQTATGGYTSMSATLTLIGTDIYRLDGTVKTDTDGDVKCRLAILDGSYSDSFSASGSEVAYLGGLWVDPLAADTNPPFSTDGAAAVWSIMNGNAGTPAAPATDPEETFTPIVPAGDHLGTWNDSKGWFHAFHRYSSQQITSLGSFYLWFLDPENPDGSLDISNIYVGPSYQPTSNVKRISETIDPQTRGRVWTLGFEHQIESEAHTEWLALAQKVKVASNPTTSAGGVRYYHNATPILVILDPDETLYGQEQMIYGYVTAFSRAYQTYSTTQSSIVWRVDLTIEEAMK